jgi:hypothetical protein
LFEGWDSTVVSCHPFAKYRKDGARVIKWVPMYLGESYEAKAFSVIER